MSDANGMPYDPIQGQGHEPLKLANCTIFVVFVSRDFELGSNDSCDS